MLRARGFAIYSTPGNAVIYLDYVRGNAAGTITREQGGLMAISVDPMMKEKRPVYSQQSTDYRLQSAQLDGSSLTTWQTPWVNVDNELGIVSKSARRRPSPGKWYVRFFWQRFAPAQHWTGHGYSWENP